MTANQDYFDAQLRHQIGVRRYTSGEVKQMLAILEKQDKELATKLRQRLSSMSTPMDLTSKRWQAMIADIKTARNTLWRELYQRTKTGGTELAAVEVDFENRMLTGVLPIEINLASVNMAQLKATLNKTPFAGGTNAARNLQQWYAGLDAADQARIIEALQMGVINGESVQQMVTRVIGTKAQGYTNGALAMSRRNAEAIVRTYASFVTNTARDSFFTANEDVIYALMWNATLDGRTSAICRGRDGHYAPVSSTQPLPANKFYPRLYPKDARPPAHPNCRSVMTSILDPNGVMEKAGARPFVRDTRTRRMREKNFRADAKANVGKDTWSTMTPNQRNIAVRKERMTWGNNNIGTVPADTTYNDWMRRQPAAFQDDVLGKTKAELFRTGKINLDQYIDRAGNELTLKQLAKDDPAVFKAAGLDPDNY